MKNMYHSNFTMNNGYHSMNNNYFFKSFYNKPGNNSYFSVSVGYFLRSNNYFSISNGWKTLKITN